MITDRSYYSGIDRHPYPVQRVRDRIALSVDRLLLILAALTVAAMIGGAL